MTRSIIPIERRVLEAFAAEEYRAGRLTHPELRRMLGFATHIQLDAFLKGRETYAPYGLTDLEQERAELARLGLSSCGRSSPTRGRSIPLG